MRELKKLIVLLMLLLIATPVIAENTEKAYEIPDVKEVYSLGEHDENLLLVKQRLQELEYYSAEAAKERLMNECYTIDLVARIKRFQIYSGLQATGNLDSQTLSLLFSDEAMTDNSFYAQDESKIPEYFLFCIGDSATFDFSGEYVYVSPKVRNGFKDKTVIACEIRFLPYSIWDKPMFDESNPPFTATIFSIKPGETKTSNKCALYNYKEMYDVLIGISKFKLQDGTVVEVPEDKILYYTWRGPFKPN